MIQTINQRLTMIIAEKISFSEPETDKIMTKEKGIITRETLEMTIKKCIENIKAGNLPEIFTEIRNRKISLIDEKERRTDYRRYKKEDPVPEKPIGRTPIFVRRPVIPEEVLVKKEVKLNLNKLTPDNFDIIRKEILKLAEKKIDYCETVAKMVVENAWKQSKYVNVYAKLCAYLDESVELCFDQDKTAGDKKKKNIFRAALLKEIQIAFEDTLKSKKSTETDGSPNEDKSEDLDKINKTFFGNLAFIGELFIEKVLSIKIIYLITSMLFATFMSEYNHYQLLAHKPTNKTFEDILEGLIKLYAITGKNIEEKEKNSKSHSIVGDFVAILGLAHPRELSSEDLLLFSEDKMNIASIFELFETIITKVNISTRIKSLIQNLIDMKEKGWEAPLSKGEGPKTMKEIHDEFNKEMEDMERSGEEYRKTLNNSINHKKLASVIIKYDIKKDNPKLNISSTNTTINTNNANADHRKIERELKDIYKMINGEKIPDKQGPFAETKKLVRSSSGKHVLEVFLGTFYDGKVDDVKKRLLILDILLDIKCITTEEFIEKLNEGMSKAADFACDFPGIENNFALILLNFCRKTKCEDTSVLSKINFFENLNDDADPDLALDFCESFLESILENLEGEYVDLKANIKSEEVKAFENKIKRKDC